MSGLYNFPRNLKYESLLVGVLWHSLGWNCWNSSHTVPNVQLVEICHCRGIFDYFATGDTELIICNYHDLSWRFVISEGDWNARAEYQSSQEKGIEWSRRSAQRLKTSGFPWLYNLINYCISYLIQPGHWWDFHFIFWQKLPLVFLNKGASNAVGNRLERFWSERNAQALSDAAAVVKVTLFRKGSVLDEGSTRNRRSSKRDIDLRVKFHAPGLYSPLST